ncbi:MAG: DUF3325 family protein [Pseudomonadota bacterium]
MDLLTITALLYISSFAFFHAAKKRTAFTRVKNSVGWQRVFTAFAWTGVAIALALIVSRRGFEVGIPLWIGAWVLAAVLSVFLQALWSKAHLPSALASVALFGFGAMTVSWGTFG